MKLSSLYSLNKEPKQGIKIGKWYTPNSSGVYYDNGLEALVVNRKSKRWNYNASFEIKFPKGYLKDKKKLKIKYKGKGWFSVKLIESAKGEQSRKHGGSWKKLVTVREAEFISLSDSKLRSKSVKLRHFYSKPFNVSLKAFIEGLKPFQSEKVASCEVTVRQGAFLFFQIDFE